jgi:HEAT repeat protein
VPVLALNCHCMPAKRSFEDQLAALDSLREGSAEAATEPLRKALGHRNNYVVARSADLVREFALTELIPEVLAAFERFFSEPVKTDPQCWAKNALSRALAAFEHQDEAVFLRGMRHIQLEPVWGGRSDTAGTLRSTCALALVQCRTLSETDLLQHLLELFSDKDKSVRVEAVRAVEQIGSPAAALLLRLRAVLGADEPEMLGACYGGILRIEGKSAIPWLARFLAAGDDAAAEAALAIASDHSPESFRSLHQRFVDDAPRDPWFRSVLLSAIALTRQPEAIDFLFDLVRQDTLHSEPAVEAILRSGPSADLIRHLEQTVSGHPRLARFVADHREQQP